MKEKKSWADASKHCNSLNGELVSIASEIQNEDLEMIVRSKNLEQAWIGYSDAANEGDWKWSSPNKLGLSKKYENWNKNEPNSVEGKDCATIVKGTGKWNNHPCTEQLPFICEISESLFIFYL